MLEQESVDLIECFRGGGQTPQVRRDQGWCLVAAVWDSQGQKLLGCLRMESTGVAGDDGIDFVFEFDEEVSAALAVPAAA